MSERDKRPSGQGGAEDEFDDGHTVADPDALVRVLRHEASGGFEAEKPTRVATSLEEAVVLRAEDDDGFDGALEEQRTRLRPTPLPDAARPAPLHALPGRGFDQQPTRMARPPGLEAASEFDGGNETRFEGVPRDMEVVKPQLFSVDEAPARGGNKALVRWVLLAAVIAAIGVGIYLKAEDIAGLLDVQAPAGVPR